MCLPEVELSSVEPGLVKLAFVAQGKLDDSVGLRVRQRAQQDAVYDAEHGCVCADAECQRQNDKHSEAGTFPECAKAVFNVLPQSLHAEHPGKLRHVSRLVPL